MFLSSQFGQAFMMLYLSWFRQFLHVEPLDLLHQDFFVLFKSKIGVNYVSDTHNQCSASRLLLIATRLYLDGEYPKVFSLQS